MSLSKHLAKVMTAPNRVVNRDPATVNTQIPNDQFIIVPRTRWINTCIESGDLLEYKGALASSPPRGKEKSSGTKSTPDSNSTK